MASKASDMKKKHASKDERKKAQQERRKQRAEKKELEKHAKKVVLKETEKARSLESEISATTQRDAETSKKERVAYEVENRFSRVGPVTDEIAKPNPAKERTQTASSYGVKAAADFDGIRGKDFVKAKNKKKRGSYKGGKIDTSMSNSTKFVYSDDDEE